MRIENYKKILIDNSLDGMIISDPTSIFYLTGVKLSPGERLFVLYISKDKEPMFFINKLFFIESNIQVTYYFDTQDPIELLYNFLKNTSIIGVDKFWPSKFLLEIMNKDSSIKYINGSSTVDQMRMIKDKEEIEFMKEASRLNDMAMDLLVNEIKEGVTELELEKKLETIYERIGTQGKSFTPIVCFGKNGSDPHHENDSSTLKKGDSIIFDIGCKFNNYCSDMTRTFFYKEVSEKSRLVYELVKKANEEAIKFIKPGTRFCDIDNVARTIISQEGYGEYFTHRLGHSIGLDVHDFGDVSSNNNMEVKPGMIFSIEPGIYLKDLLGVRIEDLVLVTEEGAMSLNNYSKELIIVK
jgi:Xaa-Pro dipeptidase